MPNDAPDLPSLNLVSSLNESLAYLEERGFVGKLSADNLVRWISAGDLSNLTAVTGNAPDVPMASYRTKGGRGRPKSGERRCLEEIQPGCVATFEMDIGNVPMFRTKVSRVGADLSRAFVVNVGREAGQLMATVLVHRKE